MGIDSCAAALEASTSPGDRSGHVHNIIAMAFSNKSRLVMTTGTATSA
jgi:hypothetical protein